MTTAAVFVLLVHLAWIVLVIFGALWTRGRPVWSGFHILALLWGIVVEAGPWPCPLTLVEQFFEIHAGLAATTAAFCSTPSTLSFTPMFQQWVVTVIGVAVCACNLGIYASALRQHLVLRRASAISDTDPGPCFYVPAFTAVSSAPQLASSTPNVNAICPAVIFPLYTSLYVSPGSRYSPRTSPYRRRSLPS